MILDQKNIIKSDLNTKNFICFDLLSFLALDEYQLKIYFKDYYFVIWSGKKKISYMINHEIISLPKNHFLYLAPGILHSFVKDISPVGTFVILFKEEFYARTLAESINLQNSKLFSIDCVEPIKNTICNEATFKSLFIEAISGENVEYSVALNRNILDRILLNGQLAYNNLFDKGIKNNNFDALLASKFKALLQENIYDEKQVSFYANKLYITKRRLDKATLNVYHKSAKEMIIGELIKCSKILLSHTDKQIKDISVILNFPQETNFTAFFKKHTGISPSEFRKSIDF